MVHATHLDDKWTWYVFLAVPSGLLKALRTMVLQPKLADVSFTFFSTPEKNDT